MISTFKTAIVGLALAASMLNAGGATASTGSSTPTAMQFFCRAHPAECAGSSSSSVAMSENLLSLLQSVTKRVNGRIRYKAESVDMWTLNPSRGDCEDFALSKRSALIKAGVPAGALRVALTYTRRGAPHAVLVVKTSRGNYVLDNLNNQVVSLGASGYRIRMMSGANPLNWTRG